MKIEFEAPEGVYIATQNVYVNKAKRSFICEDTTYSGAFQGLSRMLGAYCLEQDIPMQAVISTGEFVARGARA